ncbi:hypothetical protein ACLOJK_033193 [Asimina triloba]
MESSTSVHGEDSVASQPASYGVEEVGPQAEKSKNKNKNKNALTLKERMNHQEMVVSTLRDDMMRRFDDMIMRLQRVIGGTSEVQPVVQVDMGRREVQGAT